MKWTPRYKCQNPFGILLHLSWSLLCMYLWFLGGTRGKEPICQWRRCKRWGFDPWVRKIPLEKGMAIHSSILAWRIPRTEEPGRLQSKGLQRAEHDWVTNTLKIPYGWWLSGDLEGEGEKGKWEVQIQNLSGSSLSWWLSTQSFQKQFVISRENPGTIVLLVDNFSGALNQQVCASVIWQDRFENEFAFYIYVEIY